MLFLTKILSYYLKIVGYGKRKKSNSDKGGISNTFKPNALFALDTKRNLRTIECEVRGQIVTRHKISCMITKVIKGIYNFKQCAGQHK